MKLTMAVVGAFVLIWCWFGRNGIRRSRHLRMQKKARNQLDVINRLPEFRQRIAYLRKINAFVFEEMLMEAIERAGHSVYRNKRYTGDGGIDGKALIDGHYYLIQAKRYTGHVTTEHVSSFSQLVKKNKCRGIFCHTGKTRPATKDSIRGIEYIEIISGQKLLDLLEGKYIPGSRFNIQPMNRSNSLSNRDNYG